jgi:hypothetical protein
MTAPSVFNFNLGLSTLILLGLLILVIVVALCLKDHVKTRFRFRSFDLFLEAYNDKDKVGKKESMERDTRPVIREKTAPF